MGNNKLFLFYKLICFISIVIKASYALDENGIYKIGVGIGDITGPPAGIVLVYKVIVK